MANSCELSQRFQVRETRFAIKHTDAHRVLTSSNVFSDRESNGLVYGTNRSDCSLV